MTYLFVESGFKWLFIAEGLVAASVQRRTLRVESIGAGFVVDCNGANSGLKTKSLISLRPKLDF